MELLLRILFWCPRCWRTLGHAIFTVSGALAIAGLRLLLRVERIERRSGGVVDVDKTFQALPVPSTPESIAFALFIAMIGAALALAGKRAQKM